MRPCARPSGRSPRPWIALLATTALVVASPIGARAEPYVAPYAGAIFIHDTDLDARVDLTGPASLSILDGTVKDVDFDTGWVGGLKLGVFFDPPVLGGHLGVEIDVQYFESDIGSQRRRFSGTLSGTPFEGDIGIQGADVEIWAIGLNSLYRFPLLTSTAFPRGRLQPYVGLGAGAFIATLSTTTTPLDVDQDIEDTDIQPGFQVLAGTRIFLTRNVALFAEYKFVHTSEFEFQFEATGTFMGVPATEHSRDRATLRGSQLYGGISIHW
jgi:opacity protein-like surface antigen